MAQLLVRQLDEAVKEALRRRARHNGRSMEEEARLILAQAVAASEDSSLGTAGLGHRMAALFSDAGLAGTDPRVARCGRHPGLL